MSTMELNDRDNIQNFINACDDMIKGKFIMADSKISKILESIAVNEELYNLINDSLRGYNFQREYEKALNECDNGIYQTPEDIKKIIAFVMCLFVEVDHYRIRFYDFISRFFRNAGAGNEYAEFVKCMLTPFKEGVVAQFNSANYSIETMNIRNDVKSVENDIYMQLSNQLKLFKNEVNLAKKISAKKKEEINIYVSGCIEAVGYKNKKLFSALITALDKEVRNEKVLKTSYNALTSLFLKLYD